MSDYRHGSHTTFSIHLHIVWITKYRPKALRGEVAERVRAIVREECQTTGGEHSMILTPPAVAVDGPAGAFEQKVTVLNSTLFFILPPEHYPALVVQVLSASHLR